VISINPGLDRYLRVTPGAGFAGSRPGPVVLGQPQARLLDDPVKMLSEPFRPSLS